MLSGYLKHETVDAAPVASGQPEGALKEWATELA